ncbi:MAG: hypothetical protein MUC31_06470, partial [Bacteroidales bacterium]|nr:hypothetical protein [Bacteroidales bacterium]
MLNCDLILSQVSITSDGTLPDNSAMLDVKSTEKGVLIPRMTMEQRELIDDPATGLVIFQTDNIPGLYYNSGTPEAPAWATVGSNAAQWLTNGTSLYYNAGNVGIGTADPTAKLHVEGGDALINGVSIGRGGGNVALNTAIGYMALGENIANSRNTAIG